MRRLFILSLFALSLIMRVPAAEASTPGQAMGIAVKAKADAEVRFKAQALARARAVVAAHTDAIAKSKAKAISAFSVRTEVARRTEAAEKAAKINIDVTSFKTLSLTPQSHVSKKQGPNIEAGRNHKSLFVHNHDGLIAGHHVHGGQKASELRGSR